MNSDIKISWNNPEKRGRPIFSWRVWVPTETPHRSCLISYLILIGYWSIAANYVSLRIFTDRNLCYSGAAFEPRTAPLFDWQTRNFSTINQQWILWLFTKYLMDMFPSFWIIRPLAFGKFWIFHPHRDIPLITLFLGIMHSLFIQGLKDHRYFDVGAKFLV